MTYREQMRASCEEMMIMELRFLLKTIWYPVPKVTIGLNHCSLSFLWVSLQATISLKWCEFNTPAGRVPFG